MAAGVGRRRRPHRLHGRPSLRRPAHAGARRRLASPVPRRRRADHLVACDDSDAGNRLPGLEGECTEETAFVPIPSYALRLGLADRVELGVGVGADTTLQVDLKLQLLRSNGLDVAVAPTVGGSFLLPLRFDDDSGDGGFVAALPLFVGLRLGDVTLVPDGAIGYQRADTSGPLHAASLAVYFPVSDGLRLGPGLTAWRPLANGNAWQLLGGVTFALGDAPDE